ncbi:uncharacterized protein B0I36DRAFT_322669 [Microdochium trichocladiopsis]|uniref:Acid phosphatase-like protein n=1 Tax=Microdochium trichocladiopsis TaxID=1682393 RepID=A0A9P9BQF3_9PEZI|nr:uncharacterized protein B0I36DRAFT_322669 [Microdochium trichocladiopsis]KAH7030872.1 hypothetical protein B0I36DRAFT_322669 [Microdochium trichocladiopsis]
MHPAGVFFIVLFVLLIAGAVAWVVFTQLRARRLGLPPPTLSSYNPFSRKDNHSPYGPPTPAPGGIGAWISDKIRSIRGPSNKRSQAGGYEQSRRGFGPLDPDEAWDTRVGNEADNYGPGGYYEEQELGLHGGPAGGGGAAYGHTAYASAGPQDRGRAGPSAAAAASNTAAPGSNPFDDDSAEPSNLRGVSPRPIDTSVANAGSKKHHGPGSGSPGSERRSMFREDVM